MKTLAKTLENQVMVRLFAFMGIGAALSAIMVNLLTIVQEYREFLYVVDTENQMVLSTAGWILLWLPLLFYLAIPKERGRMSLGSLMLIFLLFSGLIGAALSGIAIVYIKANIAGGLSVSAGAFWGMSLVGAISKKDMISWHCILLTFVWGIVLSLVGYWLFSLSLTDLGVSLILIIVYCSITAYSGDDVHKLISGASKSPKNKLAIRGALIVYLNLVGLVVKLLRFWANKSEEKK